MRHEAIRKAYPNVVTISIDNTETVALDKDDKVVSLDETKILKETKKLQADYDSKQYQRDRSTEYPELPEQLDMLFHAIDAGALDKTSAFYTTLKAVKDKYPKG